MFITPRSGAWMLLFVFSLGATSAAAQNAFTEPGFQKNHDYLSLLPFEHIDLGTGSVILTFTDLAVPGNAGRDLKFQRTYNNKNQLWTYGIAGMVMSVRDSWPPLPPQPNDPFPAASRPELYGADGSKHQTYILSSDPLCPVLAECRWVSTNLFWWFDRLNRKLYFPDGVVSSYDGQGRLTQTLDPFGNSVTIDWTAQAGGQATVTIDLGNGQNQEITLDLLADSQVGYNASSYVPTKMTFRTREWTYLNPLTLESVTPPVVSAPGVDPPVHARGWSYSYAFSMSGGDNLSDVFVNTPNGAQIKYRSMTKFYPPAIPGGQDTHTTNLTERTVTGRDIPIGSTWIYEYELAPPSPEWGPHAGGNRRLTAPDETKTWFQFGGLDVGFVRREVVDSGGTLIEREIRQYVEKPTIGYPHPSIGNSPAVKAVLTRALIRRHDRFYLTDYEYNPSNHSNYHRPSKIVEKGNVDTDGDGEVERTTTLEYDYNFNLDPSANDAPYFNGKVGVETVTLQGESLVRSWEFDDDTGFLDELIEYGIHTEYDPDAFGNVAATRPGGLAAKQTSFTYKWGVLENTITPLYTVSREINPEGTVKWEIQGGRKTSFEYDNVFRLKETQPPGPREPIERSYNNIDGSNMIVARGPSSVNTTLDGLGRPIVTLDNEGVRTRTGYDNMGRLSYQGYPHKLSGTPAFPDIGTAITYDGLGRVKRRTNPSDPGIESYVEHTYDPGTVAIRDENNHITTQTWQAFGHPDDGRLVSLTDANSQLWEYTYNALGKMTKVKMPGGRERVWTYDPAKQYLTSETHPESGTVTYSDFDDAGVPRDKTDARGTLFHTTYDDNYRVREVNANSGARITTTTYEPDTDNRESVSVGNVSTSFGYEPLTGRLATRSDTIGGRTYSRTYEYDASDRLTLLTYPSDRQVKYEYDNEGRITLVRDMTASRDIATDFVYHPSGAPTSFTSGNGIVNEIVYDPKRYWPRSVTAGDLHLSYDNYDLTGNVRTIGDNRPGMGQTIAYDELDRLKTANGPYGALTYAYDALGNRQTAGGVSYNYDPLKLRLLSQNGQNFGYDDAGNMISAGDSIFGYNTDQQMVTALVPGSHTPTTYGYDGDGWRASKSGPPGGLSDYLRGPAGELLAEVQGPGAALSVTRDYIYAGRRLLAVTGGVTSSITFTDPTITAGVTTIMATHVFELRQVVNGYRLAAGLSEASWTDSFLPNAPIKAVHIQELRARLDEARAALGYAAASYTDLTLTAGTTAIRAVHLTELRTLMQQPGTSGSLRYYHVDAIGSVRMTTDHAGAVVARYDYQPFGEPLAASSEPRRFTGAERDAETGFDYFGARYYQSQIGRLTSVDPGHVGGDILNPQSWNGYSYALNNPLRFVDPLGTDPCQITLTGADAAAAGVADGGTVEGDCVRAKESWTDRMSRNFFGILDALTLAAPVQAPGLGQADHPLVERSPDTAVAMAAVVLTRRVPIPKLKSSPFGPKIASPVPGRGVPRHWTGEDIQDAIVNYKASIASRRAELNVFDAIGRGSATQRLAHAQRITQEEAFLRSLERALGR
jgi:RHS repeat-associated protein